MYHNLSRGKQVFLGVSVALSFSVITFFGPGYISGKSNKAGHNLFDVDKPEAVIEQQERIQQGKLDHKK